jgi:hypothetical protein
MRNQIIMWALFVVPWFTLFFMKGETIKRYMPVAILSSLGVVLLNEISLSLGWWSFPEKAYPLQIIHPDFIGLFPVMTIWIFRFTYRKFLLFILTEIIVNLLFSFLFVRLLLGSLGIVSVTGMTGIMVFVLSTGLAAVLYGYQKWQEDAFKQPYGEGGK